MNATVLFTTQHPFREGEGKKKKNKEVKNASSSPVTVSAPVSEVALLSGTFSLSPGVFALRAFTLLPCLPTSGVKHRAGFHIPLRLARSQPLFVFVAPVRESGCGQAEGGGPC